MNTYSKLTNSNMWFYLNYMIKKFFDLVFSLILLIILSPIMLIISLLIKITSKGPIIFKQKRLTKKGKEFNMYKFRTMVDGAEKKGSGLFAYDNDPRITKIGKILRKTSLDELPQLINIIFLKMSFVGPRPPVNYELGEYKNLSDEYKKRFRFPAGITGLAQISGRNELDWDLKVKKDNEYIEKFKKIGYILDIYILFMTVLKVFRAKDINEEEPEEFKELTDEEKNKIMMERVANMASKSMVDKNERK